MIDVHCILDYNQPIRMDFNHEEEAIAGLDLDRRKIKAVAELFSTTQS